MSKRITLDPNLLSLSGPKPSRKSKKKFDKTKKADKAHNVNYEKLLGKIKEMKKNKLQQTRKKKQTTEQNTNIPKKCDVKIEESALTITTNEPKEITQETTFEKNSNPSTETPIIINTPIAVAPPPTMALPTMAPPTAVPPVTTPIIIQPEPQFGILKNGTKPTRRNRAKSTTTRFEKLRTIKRKYQLGKNGRKISVLLKDNKTRKKIKSEVQDLKQKSIKEVRTFLQERNMIKAGSIAPNNVLRKMYEDMYLTGNIENKNSDNLIHNYVNDEESII
jgi:hypothetical protein